MKLGVMAALFGEVGLDGALEKCREYALDCIELPVGYYGGKKLVDAGALLSDARARKAFQRKISDAGLEISALSAHGNPLHPERRIAEESHRRFQDAVRLAKKLGVEVVCGFSGCPGGSPADRTPNWVTCAWPDDFAAIATWQWEKKLIPYWKEQVRFASDHGVRIALEMHPGFSVYNADTLIRLREKCGKAIGANLDPSHLFWQGMDPLACVRALAGCIWHVHAKDCRIEPATTAVKGVLDTRPYREVLARSWVFCTVGYGHGPDFWGDFIRQLRAVGYDGAISIEHEDSLMSMSEGFGKAVALLKQLILRERAGASWWQ